MTTASPAPSAASASPVWERWLPIWHSLFYAGLLASIALQLIGSAYVWWQYLLIFGVSLLLGVWYSWMARFGPGYWRAHPSRAVCVLAIGWACWSIVVFFFPTYLLLLFGLYPQVFIFLRLPWNIAGGLTLALLTLVGQALEIGGWDWWLLIPFGAGGVGILMAVFIEAIARQSNQRKQLIDELRATHQELATAERQGGRLEERARLTREIQVTASRQMRRPAQEALSARELEVLALVARGSSNKETAQQLHISEATVKTHLIHIFGKLGVTDRTAAVMTALERGLLHLE